MKNGSMSGRRLTAQTAITAPQATRTSVMGAVLCGSKKNRSHHSSRGGGSRVRLIGVGHVREVDELVVRRWLALERVRVGQAHELDPGDR